jgi:hypothetical protein
MSRSIDMMHPRLQAQYKEFQFLMGLRKLDYIITSVDRSILEQMALYVQGRLEVLDVNKIRQVAGLSFITEGENKVVTWTLDSMHVTNMFDETLDNDLSRAFDIALTKFKRPHWGLKISVNDNEKPDYEEVGDVAIRAGLAWGGPYGDYCHFELKEGI